MRLSLRTRTAGHENALVRLVQDPEQPPLHLSLQEIPAEHRFRAMQAQRITHPDGFGEDDPGQLGLAQSRTDRYVAARSHHARFQGFASACQSLTAVDEHIRQTSLETRTHA